MLTKSSKEARAALQNAREIARTLGAPRLEAEHLLLAVTRADTPAAAALREAGLDYDGLLDALERELQHSLAAVGVSIEPPPASPPVEPPNWGTSAKTAFHRAGETWYAEMEATGRRGRKFLDSHLALGVLAARVGTVPRALELAGVDIDALRARLAAAC
jgi:ATP-dependent Clp protease ATP-binding subunit ClpA